MADTKENETLGNELQIYELGFHILPIVPEEGLEKEVSSIKAIIEKNGGLFIGEEGSPKLIKLAYSMSKVLKNKRTVFDTAYFGWFKFEANPSSILKVEENLKKVENILRFLLIKSVRESKMVSKRPMFGVASTTPKAEDPKKNEEISEEQVDQAIEELVLE